jgi:hypothetical protein
MVKVMPLRPSCPASGNPIGLASLYTVLEFVADEICQSVSLIAQFHEQVRRGDRIPTRESMGIIAGYLGALERHSKSLGLNTTSAQIARVKDMILGDSQYPLQMTTIAIMEVSTRLVDELKSRKLYMVSSERNAYLEGNQFHVTVGTVFPEAIADMDEAAKCFAFERPTACIFHLMRVTEVGIKAIADLLEITDHAPTWEPIIRKIDAELKADYKDRKYKGDQDFLANASTHLHAVKVAWRNKTMHVEKINTMEHGKEIYDATCGFMRYLAENFPQRRTGIVQSIRGRLGV